jgi:hypothetical protein
MDTLRGFGHLLVVAALLGNAVALLIVVIQFTTTAWMQVVEGAIISVLVLAAELVACVAGLIVAAITNQKRHAVLFGVSVVVAIALWAVAFNAREIREGLGVG